MNTALAEIEALKKLAAQSISKRKLEALQTAHSGANSLFERLEPKSPDEATRDDFESACGEVESALDDLDSAIGNLEMAEDKDERDDAISEIECALEEAASALEEIMLSAVVGTQNPYTLERTIKQECLAKLTEFIALPQDESVRAFNAWRDDWLGANVSAELKQKRWKTLQKILSSSQKNQPSGE